MQTDKRWAKIPYQVKGETTDIAGSGCGPTCAASVVKSIRPEDTITPVEACQWSLNHGYKALNQGTYYSFFVPFFKACGLVCQRINTVSWYKDNKTGAHRDEADRYLSNRFYLIACMGKGTWTKSGHFIVIYGFQDGKYLIMDPASKALNRRKGDPYTVFHEMKYLWAIPAPDEPVQEEKPDIKEVETMTTEEHLIEHNKMGELPADNWSLESREWCIKNGIFKGDGTGNMAWKQPLTREQFATLVPRIVKLIVDAVKEES